ncbi:MAG TPA: hydrogenase maturation nickel metallochaperone HypA [Coprothermobacter sp.]|nr:hydrogenase maturation nickel metallochaperone HypA [Coprothermobacter sp.]
MHEYYVAKHTIYQIKKELGEIDPNLVKSVGLKIGKMSGIIPDALNMYLNLIAPEEGLTNATFDIVLAPVLFQCNDCKNVFEPSRELFWCPKCKSSNVTFISGNELEIQYIDVENSTNNNKEVERTT